MAAKWQQWMPFHIDRFKGSPAVQAMPHESKMAYWYLLSAAWQTDDCTLSSDPLDLAEKSGLGDERWAILGPRILRKFDILENGRLRNPASFEQWQEAKRIHEARQDAAKKTTEIRSPRKNATVTVEDNDAHRTVTDSGASRSADTPTR